MTWAALLLADPSPCLRRLVLRDLLGRGPGDAELAELDAASAADPLVGDLLAAQRPDGAWGATTRTPRWTRCGRRRWLWHAWGIWGWGRNMRRYNAAPPTCSGDSKPMDRGRCRNAARIARRGPATP
jgi:hypothetical protein